MPSLKNSRKDSSPTKMALKELAQLRRLIRETTRSLHRRLAKDLEELTGKIASSPEHALLKGRALRDMLLVMRGLEIKPAKGRRRDLKKIEEAVRELQFLVEEAGS